MAHAEAMKGRAYVLGGGVAGIVAALRLADSGRAVTLLEAHRWLGGRAFSRFDERIGDEVDNGPHVILGCYDHFRALLRRLGTEGEFERQSALRLRFREAGGRTSELKLPAGPPRLGLVVAALRFRGMRVTERLRLVRGLGAAALGARRDETLEQWLTRTAQHGAPRRFLWEPLCRAILNAAPGAVSASLFLATLMRAFGQGRHGAAIWFPKVGWSRVLGAPAEAELRRSGVEVRFGCEVVELDFAATHVRGVVLRSGERIALGAEDELVVALPWLVTAKLGVSSGGTPVPVAPAAGITTAHFAGLGLPDEGPLVGLVDGAPFHFVCRRPGAPADRFALLASGDFSGCERAATAEELARAQLARYYPGVDASVGRVRIVRMAAATACFSPVDAEQRARPGRHQRFTNLTLCGDATATGLPATLESAAFSARG